MGQANAPLTTLEPWSEVHPPEVVFPCYYVTALESPHHRDSSAPFIPHASGKLLDRSNVTADERTVAYARVGKSEVGGGLLMDVKGVKLLEQPPSRRVRQKFEVPLLSKNTIHYMDPIPVSE